MVLVELIIWEVLHLFLKIAWIIKFLILVAIQIEFILQNFGGL